MFYDKHNWPQCLLVFTAVLIGFFFYDYWAAIFDNLASDIVICCAIFPASPVGLNPWCLTVIGIFI